MSGGMSNSKGDAKKNRMKRSPKDKRREPDSKRESETKSRADEEEKEEKKRRKFVEKVYEEEERDERNACLTGPVQEELEISEEEANLPEVERTDNSADLDKTYESCSPTCNNPYQIHLNPDETGCDDNDDTTKTGVIRHSGVNEVDITDFLKQQRLQTRMTQQESEPGQDNARENVETKYVTAHDNYLKKVKKGYVIPKIVNKWTEGEEKAEESNGAISPLYGNDENEENNQNPEHDYKVEEVEIVISQWPPIKEEYVSEEATENTPPRTVVFEGPDDQKHKGKSSMKKRSGLPWSRTGSDKPTQKKSEKHKEQNHRKKDSVPDH